MIKQSYLSRRFDEAAILGAFMKIAFTATPDLSDADYGVLAALRRSSKDWELSIDETSRRLATYDEESISGLVSNVKGILHELEFQKIENEDGDSVIAAIFPDTNHKSVDVQLMDQSTGVSWDVQLKATDSESYVLDWMESNPDTEILVTDELSERMGLSSSGVSNEELTVRVEEFVNKMLEIDANGDESLWNYFPALSAISSGIIVFEIWRRYRSGIISYPEFKALSLKTLGLKAAKFGAIFTALSVPGLNIIIAAYLLGSLIYAANRALNSTKPYKPFSSYT